MEIKAAMSGASKPALPEETEVAAQVSDRGLIWPITSHRSLTLISCAQARRARLVIPEGSTAAQKSQLLRDNRQERYDSAENRAEKDQFQHQQTEMSILCAVRGQ